MKKLGLFLLMGACVLFALIGCGEEELLPGSIYGVVTDKATGEPIRSAGVELSPGGAKTITGSDGSYEFAELEAGKYTLLLTKTGYEPFVSNEIKVEAGKKVKTDIQLTLEPPSLRIVDDNKNDISELDFGSSSDDVTRMFNIFNDGVEKIEWTITTSVDWIESVSRTEGELGSGKTQAIIVTIDRSKLESGENVTAIHVTSNNGSKQITVKAANGNVKAVVNTLAITDIKSSSVVLNGEIVTDGNPKYTERGFVYSTTENPTVETSISRLTVTMSADKKFDYLLDKLTPEVTYYVRAYCIQNGDAVYGNSVSFNTSQYLPILTTMTAQNVTGTSATFVGVVDNVGIPPYTERGFVYSTTSLPTYENSLKPIPTAPVNESSQFSSDVYNLTVGETYYVRAYAKSALGYAYSSNEVVVSTKSVAPSVVVNDVSDVTVNSAILHGEIIEIGDPAYTERGFCYGTTYNPTIYNQTVVANGVGVSGVFDKQIVSLEENTNYYVRAYVRVGSDAPIYSSEVKQFMTSEAIPPVVHTNDVTQIGVQNATFVGFVDVAGVPVYTERGFCYSTTPNPTIYNQYVVASGYGVTGTFTKTVNGLYSNQQYYVRAYVKVGNGEPVYGEEKFFMTEDNSSTATVSVTDHLVICNGIGFWFDPSSDTRLYYWKLYEQSDLAGMSDNAIKSDLLQNGVNMQINGYNYDYSSDCTPSTQYVLCVVATDVSGKMGPLTKQNFTTPSSANQPIALINLISCGGGSIDFSVLKSATCHSFSVCVMNPFDGYESVPDIFWAMLFYRQDFTVYDENQVITDYVPDAPSSDVGFITIGYGASGNMSGVITKKVCNAVSGVIYNVKQHSKRIKPDLMEVRKNIRFVNVQN